MASLKSGATELIITPEREKFSELRHRYRELGTMHANAFLPRYAAFKTADELFLQFPAFIDKVLSDTATHAASDLAANGVFDVGVQTIGSELEARKISMTSDYQSVRARYYDIVEDATRLNAQQRAAVENRGRIVGGGFGVEGAARGMAMAAAANTAIGVTQRLANLPAKAASELGGRFLKKEILKDPATKAAMGDYLIQVALQGCEFVAAHVNKDKGEAVFGVVGRKSREKASAMLENITAGRVPEPEIAPVLIQALSLDPFSARAWAEWLWRFGDADGSADLSAARLHIDTVGACKTDLLSKRRSQLDWTTPEACRESGNALEPYAVWLGMAFDAEREQIEQKAQELDLARRTFRDTTYATEAEAKDARAEYERQLSIQQDLDRRTFNGMVYATQAEADAERFESNFIDTRSMRAISWIGWMFLPLKRIGDYKGRSRKEELWGFLAVAGIIALASAITLISMGYDVGSAEMNTAELIFLIVVAISLVPLEMRRLQDVDLPGWLVLVNLIPYVGWLVIVPLAITDGSVEENKYGLPILMREVQSA